jgi:hypothetical protein
MTPLGDNARILLVRFLVTSAVMTSAVLSALTLNGSPWGFVQLDSSRVIQDFASILNYSKDFWEGHNSMPYTEEGHLGFMRRWTGEDQNQAMLCGYSPTMFVTLYPLTWLHSMISYFIWVLTPFALLLCLAKKQRDLQLLLISALTATTLGTVALGQTSPWMLLAALAVLNFLTSSTSKKESFSGIIAVSLVVFLTTAKPPAALSLIFLLLLDKRWKILTIVGLLVLTEISLFTLYLGPSWISDYIHLLLNYSKDIAPSSLASTLHPETMSNMQLMLHYIFGFAWSLAGKISNFIWISGSLLVVFWGWRVARSHFENRLEMAFCFLWGLYLLCSSHLTFTEDLLILIPVWLARNMQPKLWWLTLTLSWIALNMGLNKPLLNFELGTLLLFFLKGGILCLCAYHFMKPHLKNLPKESGNLIH